MEALTAAVSLVELGWKMYEHVNAKANNNAAVTIRENYNGARYWLHKVTIAVKNDPASATDPAQRALLDVIEITAAKLSGITPEKAVRREADLSHRLQSLLVGYSRADLLNAAWGNICSSSAYKPVLRNLNEMERTKLKALCTTGAVQTFCQEKATGQVAQVSEVAQAAELSAPRVVLLEDLATVEKKINRLKKQRNDILGKLDV